MMTDKMVDNADEDEREYQLMKRNVKLLIIMFLVVLSCSVTFSADNSKREVSVVEVKRTKKTGWEKRGKHYYYRKKGKFLKSCIAKIGKYIYGFDKKGRSICSKTARFKGSYYDFDPKGRAILRRSPGYKNTVFYCYKAKSNKYIYAYEDLKMLHEVDSDAKHRSWVGYNVHYKPYQSLFSFTCKNTYYANGTPFPMDKVKKGMVVRIFFKGAVTDSIPSIYENILKIVVL